MTAQISQHERVRHGEYAEDVVYLRDVCGLLVAPFRDGYRINNDVVTKDELRERAAQERTRRPAPKPRAAKASAADPVADCPCGRPSNHYGRCWVRRGLTSAPAEAIDKSSGGADGRAARGDTSRGKLPGEVERTTPAQCPAAVGVEPGPLDADIAARLDRLEQRMDDFFRLLAIAVGGRRQSLEQQLKGLVDIEAELSTNQRSE